MQMLFAGTVTMYPEIVDFLDDQKVPDEELETSVSDHSVSLRQVLTDK